MPSSFEPRGKDLPMAYPLAFEYLNCPHHVPKVQDSLSINALTHFIGNSETPTCAFPIASHGV